MATEKTLTCLVAYREAGKRSKVERKKFGEDKKLYVKTRNDVSIARRIILTMMNAMVFGNASDRPSPSLTAWMRLAKFPGEGSLTHGDMTQLAQSLAMAVRSLYAAQPKKERKKDAVAHST